MCVLKFTKDVLFLGYCIESSFLFRRDRLQLSNIKIPELYVWFQHHALLSTLKKVKIGNIVLPMGIETITIVSNTYHLFPQSVKYYSHKYSYIHKQKAKPQ